MHKSLAQKFEGSRSPAENENYDISPKSWRMDMMIVMMKYPDTSSKNFKKRLDCQLSGILSRFYSSILTEMDD